MAWPLRVVVCVVAMSWLALAMCGLSPWRGENLARGRFAEAFRGRFAEYRFETLRTVDRGRIAEGFFPYTFWEALAEGFVGPRKVGGSKNSRWGSPGRDYS